MDTMLVQWVWISPIQLCFTACTTNEADFDFQREVGRRGEIWETKQGEECWALLGGEGHDKETRKTPGEDTLSK